MTEMLNPDSKFMPADCDQMTLLDPALGKFLHFLARDIEEDPQNLQIISSDLVSRVQLLISEVEIDLDELPSRHAFAILRDNLKITTIDSSCYSL
jgi:prlF antitoxin for toxin YhaV_toxin